MKVLDIAITLLILLLNKLYIMILASELRIGNCVIYDTEIMIVGELFDVEKRDYDPEGKAVHLLHLNGNRYDEYLGRSTGDLMSLEIIPKFLLRMGFEQMGEYHYRLDGFMVNLKNDYPTFIYGDTRIEGIIGFHQLQNHYSDFTKSTLNYDFS